MLSLFKHHTSNFSLGVMQQNLVFNLCIYIYITVGNFYESE